MDKGRCIMLRRAWLRQCWSYCYGLRRCCPVSFHHFSCLLPFSRSSFCLDKRGWPKRLGHVNTILIAVTVLTQNARKARMLLHPYFIISLHSPPSFHPPPSTKNCTILEQGTTMLPFIPPSSPSFSVFLTPRTPNSSTHPNLHHSTPTPRKQISYLPPGFINLESGRKFTWNVLLSPSARVTKPFSGVTNGGCCCSADDEGPVSLPRPSHGTAGPWPSLSSPSISFSPPARALGSWWRRSQGKNSTGSMAVRCVSLSWRVTD